MTLPQIAATIILVMMILTMSLYEFSGMIRKRLDDGDYRVPWVRGLFNGAANLTITAFIIAALMGKFG